MLDENEMTTVLQSLNDGLHKAFASNPRVHLLGEDVLDPYGGAFKVSRGLSSAYPQRVFTTPISEAGIVGVAAGMALRGLRPVVEIMFGDFVTLIADQVINHIAKFRWMYNDQVRVPMLIRSPMGGRRGYGPTHSQSLEKIYLGAPGMRVVAPCAITTNGYGPGELLAQSILKTQDPVLFIENKLLYLVQARGPVELDEFDLRTIPSTRTSEGGWDGFDSEADLPAYSLTIREAPAPQITLAAYGYMAELARQAVLKLAYEREIFVELVVLTGLAPFQVSPIIASLHRTGKLLAIEEGTLTLGWGAEVLARCLELEGPNLKSARRLAARDLPIPASGPLEQQVLPGVDDIIRAASQMV
jgi:pyruvate/2-oxoglutarate/acetoin dehydrogenase E1 component